jgi:hypothetical protein
MCFIEQTETGAPWGNCVRAAWASLLCVPLDSIPDFDPGHLEGKNQLEEERKWMRGLGYDLIVVPAKRADPPTSIPDHVFHLMSGLSERGYGHRVVGRGGKLVWDPHPSHTGLVELWSYTFLVPSINPIEDGQEIIGFHGW